MQLTGSLRTKGNALQTGDFEILKPGYCQTEDQYKCLGFLIFEGTEGVPDLNHTLQCLNQAAGN